MKFSTWCSVVLVLAGPVSALGQTTPTPAAQPTPAPTQDAPAPPEAASEVQEIEIVEPATGPDERRTIRVVEKDGAFWVDDSGDTHDLSIVMDRSLEFNPEIRAIRAEIEALVARLKQLEMKTATDVARKGVEIRRLKDKREKDRELVEKKLKGPEELMELDAEIAARDIELKYLVGTDQVRAIEGIKGDRVRTVTLMGGDGDMLAPLGLGDSGRRPELKDIEDKRLLEILDSPITILFENQPMSEVVEFLTEEYEMNFNIDVSARDIPITINIKNVPIRSALVAMTDADQDLAFIFRDYGIFATTRERALSIPGPSIPEGVRYHEGGPIGRRVVLAPQQAEKILDYVEKPAAPRTPKAADAPAPATPAPKAP